MHFRYISLVKERTKLQDLLLISSFSIEIDSLKHIFLCVHQIFQPRYTLFYQTKLLS